VSRYDDDWAAIMRAILPDHDSWRTAAAEAERQKQLDSGQLRIGGPGDWYTTLHWSTPLWHLIRPGKFVRLI
jgi:hypothetical protein